VLAIPKHKAPHLCYLSSASNKTAPPIKSTMGSIPLGRMAAAKLDAALTCTCKFVSVNVDGFRDIT